MVARRQVLCVGLQGPLIYTTPKEERADVSITVPTHSEEEMRRANLAFASRPSLMRGVREKVAR